MRRAAIAVCLLFLAAAGRAETLASIRGTVLLKKEQFPLPDTEVTLSNPKLSVLRRTRTDQYGRFTFAAVPPGDGYEITVVAVGFATVDGWLGHLFGGRTLFLQGELYPQFVTCWAIIWSERYLTQGYFEPAPWPGDPDICL